MQLLFFIVLLCLVNGCVDASLDIGERAVQLNSPSSSDRFKILRRSSASSIHSVKFAVKLKNLDLLEQRLHNVSDPSHEDYGKHWSKEEVGRLIKNEEATENLLSYLEEEGGYVIKERSILDEFIVVEGRIESWEKMFATTFFEHEHILPQNINHEGFTIHRAASYVLPLELAPYVHAVFDVVDLPLHLADSLHVLPSSTSATEEVHPFATTNANGYVTPPFLSKQYGIRNNMGNSKTSQGVYMNSGKTMSNADLTSFLQTFSLPIQGIAASIGGAGGVKDSACAQGVTNCAEANLAVQYLQGTAWTVPTTFLYNSNNQDLISFLSSLVNPPKVIVITANVYESDVSSNYILSFNYLAMQLGVMGVTLVVAAGNDGAPGSKINGVPSLCSYGPLFPASSPYVLTVGASQGPEVGKVESSAQRSSDGEVSFTTGGGFSLRNTIPSWQSSAVSTYFGTVRGTPQQPAIGYSLIGRGYPDITALGNKFLVKTGQTFTPMSGTAASASVIAGMISLINAGRRDLNKPTIGFVNPLLYSLTNYGSLFLNDITSGSNKCTSTGTCCREGFTAVSGWDPISGLGSIKNFQVFYSLAVFGGVSAPPSPPPAARPRSSRGGGVSSTVEEENVAFPSSSSFLRGGGGVGDQ